MIVPNKNERYKYSANTSNPLEVPCSCLTDSTYRHLWRQELYKGQAVINPRSRRVPRNYRHAEGSINPIKIRDYRVIEGGDQGGDSCHSNLKLQVGVMASGSGMPILFKRDLEMPPLEAARSVRRRKTPFKASDAGDAYGG
jgi:hypothetical protein